MMLSKTGKVPNELRGLSPLQSRLNISVKNKNNFKIMTKTVNDSCHTINTISTMNTPNDKLKSRSLDKKLLTK